MSIRNLTSTEVLDIISEKPRAILAFYKIVTPHLQQYFQHKIADEHDREEIIQDTMLSILDSLPRYKAKSTFSTWILAIAHHELVDYYRRRKIKTILFSAFPFLENIADLALGPQLALEEKEAKQRIYLTLKKLNEGNAKILRLRYLEGLSVTVIARKLGISYKAAESKLSRARLAFCSQYVYQRFDLQETS